MGADTKIIKLKSRPLIGVIGSSLPTEEYEPAMGMEAGYRLRKHVGENSGTIFTGGVEGVGVDVYIGVMKACLEAGLKTGSLAEDEFFALVPNFYTVEYGISGKKHRHKLAYNPPGAYWALGALTPKGGVEIIRAGDDMDERRACLADIADFLVMINGGHGTMDEASCALMSSKKVIACTYSGGAARILGRMKNGGTFEADEEIEKSIRGVDKNLIIIAKNANEMMAKAAELYQA